MNLHSILPSTETQNSVAEKNYWGFLAGIMLVALILRVYIATHSVYIWDEERDWIPVATTISYDPANLNLPIRTWVHGAFSAYLIDFGSRIFGETHVGFRASNIILGVWTIYLTAAIGRRLAGAACGLFAAAIVAISEFHIMVSAVAIQMSHYIFFETAAVLCMMIAIQERKAAYVYFAAISAAFGFLSYEIGVLLLPLLALPLLSTATRWIWRWPHLYLAAIFALLIVTPDIYINLTADVGATNGYSNLLSRIGTIGFNPRYLEFYARDLIHFVFETLLGRPAPGDAKEYAANNLIVGILVGLGVLVWSLMFLFQRKSLPAFSGTMLLLFWGILGFFTLIDKTEGLASISLWLWIAFTLIPGAIITGAVFGQSGRVGNIGVLGLAAAVLWSFYNVAFDNLNMPQRKAIAIPEFVTGADGAFETIQTRFDFCDMCEIGELPVLESVFSFDHDKDSQPKKADEDVRGAIFGTNDIDYQVRIARDLTVDWEVSRTYHFNYRQQLSDGKNVEILSEIHVPTKPGFHWPKVFWANN